MTALKRIVSICLLSTAFLMGRATAIQPIVEDPFMVGIAAKIIKAPPAFKQVRLTYNQVVSSWYGPHFNGRLTASGTRYDQEALTVASRTLRFGTLLKISNPRNGKWVIARVTDRGPYIEGRELDVSKGVARKLDMLQVGVCPLLIAKVSEESILPILNYRTPEAMPKRSLNVPHRHMRQPSFFRHSAKHPTGLSAIHVPIVRTYTLYHPRQPKQ